ncbi:hypothetical protein A1O7_07226 [Cladophialophora yegresii CBS 114405]|uniref:Uncharacterized protein n=1 Tax=Cladophialophora yegresii CBS 114405 TaxID=1182544 RepID=W9VMI3_9EURO|nr:uncharacterized protein A1O7_07226 [Cladophialophora yegresii CBS 114405]EXJ56882.1 hypothetical protein A1O7_07226 [Cladophialophora yegresii CBS 114405]
MARNKENNPLSSSRRNDQHSRNPPSVDFFTDSLLDDSRLSSTSLIPSPSKAKPAAVKPRRALPATRALQTAKDLGNKQSRTSLLDYTNARTSKQLKSSPKLTKRKSPSPTRTNGLTTPPQSRHGPPVRSPSEFSSPPGGLHESYQRIADEEDLAATERDVDSDEEGIERDQPDTIELDMNAIVPDDVQSKGHKYEDRASNHTTPIQSPIDDRTGSLSAPPTLGTLDFVQNEMSDRVLAEKLTPHVIDRARDRARLQRLRQSVPINFGDRANGKVDGGHRRDDLASIVNRGPISFNNILGAGANGLHKAYSDTSADTTPKRKLRPLSKISRRLEPRAVPEDDGSGSDTPDELREVERTVDLTKARQNMESVVGTEGLVPGLDPRAAAFSRSYGGLGPYQDPSRTRNYRPPQSDLTTASVSSTHSEPTSAGTYDKQTRDSTRAFLARWRHDAVQRRAAKAKEDADKRESDPEPAAAEEHLAISQKYGDDAESEIDWAAAGADVPLPSIEQSSTPRDSTPLKTLPSSISKQSSVDRIRKWENDFTGMSFQVSESPPIRGRNNLNDSLREKEMEDLMKRAVTSDRLDEIRVKDPNVVVRKPSRNFTPEERKPAPTEPREQSPVSQFHGNPEVGQAIPDTPVVVYRSSSQSTDKSKSSQRSVSDSLDQLQRLARAVSTTPRASPALNDMVREIEEASAIPLPPSEEDPKARSPETRANGVALSRRVAETPKVVGAWTDTILPDTVKTQKQTQKVPQYAQTPHISAGGWIDTPLPNGARLATVPIPEVVEEVTEPVTNADTQKQSEKLAGAEDEMGQSAATGEERPEAVPQPATTQQIILPPSALTNVLNEAKQKRLVSRDINEARSDARDDTDTLNLGDATIQSMEDLLTDAADITADLTSLIRTSAEEEVLALRQRNDAIVSATRGDEVGSTSDVAFIGHLASRMERLMSNLHEARKGISRLEQKVWHAPDQQTQALVAVHEPTQSCMVCGRANDDLKSHVHPFSHMVTSWLGFPVTYTTFTLPVPLLFHPRAVATTQGSNSKTLILLPGRPTWLGYLILTFWTWYILECIMTELYARPLYAERYTFPPPGVTEPEFPFVLPTMLCRGLFGQYGSVVVGMLGNIFDGAGRVLVAIYRVFAMAVGWSDGFVDDERATRVVAAATRSAVKVAQSIVSGADGSEGLSMMNDELV